jgi:hypothetical protein
MPQNAVYRRALQRGAQICGSVELLGARLGVPAPQLKLWIDGTEPCPGHVFLSVVDLLIDSDLSSIRPAADASTKADGKPTS